MSVSPRKPRAVDHLVLPVAGLDLARDRLTRLGFTVAPDAIHPFGTENACVFFKDGTYLEPLAIAQRETCEATAQKGNVFTARDQAFRFRRGDDGFSAMALSTIDANTDHKLFRKLGFSAGKPLEFSRTFTDAKGGKSEGRFRNAFAADLRAPDAFMFTCQKVKTPASARKSFETHENGAVAIREVALGEPNPSDFQYFLEEVLNQREINAHSFGIELAAANANIAAYNPAGLKAWFDIVSSGHARGLRFRAVVIAVENFGRIEKLLKKNKIAAKSIAGRLIVNEAPGQGAVIAFEAA